MKTSAAVLLLVGIGLAATEPVHGQARVEPLTIAPALASPFAGEPSAAAVVQAPPSHGRIVMGTTVGALVGAAAGMGIVAVAGGGTGGDGNMFPWAGLAAGAVLGSIPGMYVGSRMASGGQGEPWLTGAAAVGGTALGFAAGVALGSLLAGGDSGKAPEVLGIALGVAIPVGLTSLAESRASRRR